MLLNDKFQIYNILDDQLSELKSPMPLYNPNIWYVIWQMGMIDCRAVFVKHNIFLFSISLSKLLPNGNTRNQNLDNHHCYGWTVLIYSQSSIAAFVCTTSVLFFVMWQNLENFKKFFESNLLLNLQRYMMKYFLSIHRRMQCWRCKFLGVFRRLMVVHIKYFLYCCQERCIYGKHCALKLMNNSMQSSFLVGENYIESMTQLLMKVIIVNSTTTRVLSQSLVSLY